MKKYESYKDSGIEGVGVIPEHWSIKKLKYVSSDEENSFVDGPFGSDLKSEEYVDEGIPLIQLNNIGLGVHKLNNLKYITEEKAERLSRHKIYPGDVVIAKMAEPVARATVVNDKFPLYVIVADCVRLQPNTVIVVPKFLAYMMNTTFIKSQAEIVSTGSTRIRVNLSDVKNLQAIFPPLDEQKAIVSFLNNKIGQVDTLIQKKQQMIALLEEEKTAVINDIVTKGLNPDAPMKDSGVEWLGMIPEHWQVKKLKYITNQIIDGAHFTPTYVDEGVPFLRVTDVQTKDIDLKYVKRIPLEEHQVLVKRCQPQKGDLLLSKNGTIGITKVVDWDWDFSVFVSLCLIKFKVDLINPYYFSFFFQSDVTNQQIAEGSKKTSVTNLHLEKINELVIVLPPTTEQLLIINYLNNALGRIEHSIKLVEKEIELMQEYRTALISEAVTGKIDVRNYQIEPINSKQLELA